MSGGAVALPAPRPRKRSWVRWLAAIVVLGLAVLVPKLPSALIRVNRGGDPDLRALNGTGNNVEHPGWGEGDRPYLRVAAFSGTGPRYWENARAARPFSVWIWS